MTQSTLHTTALVASLALAGCAVDTPDQSATTDDLATRKGADYAGCCASTNGLRANGYQFAARYFSYESSKNRKLGEADALRAAGIDIIVVWEQNC